MSWQEAREIQDVQDEYEPTRLEAAKWRIEELERELAECREALAAAQAYARMLESDIEPFDKLVYFGRKQPEKSHKAALDAALEQARAAERERCAQIVEHWPWDAGWQGVRRRLAEAIRTMPDGEVN